jgi:hypothetical protein
MSRLKQAESPMESAINEVGGQVDNPLDTKPDEIQKKKVRTFGDTNEKIDFFPELEQEDMKTIIGSKIKVIQVKLIRDFDSQFGKHDFMLVRANLLDDQPDFTFATSGMVLIKRMMSAQDKRQLPLIGTIAKPQGKPYYDIN